MEPEGEPKTSLVAVTITVELPYPEDTNIRIGISEARVTCVAGCDEQTEEVTDQQGEVTVVGRPPLETVNLAGSPAHRGLLRDHRNLLAAWTRQAGDDKGAGYLAAL